MNFEAVKRSVPYILETLITWEALRIPGTRNSLRFWKAGRLLEQWRIRDAIRMLVRLPMSSKHGDNALIQRAKRCHSSSLLHHRAYEFSRVRSFAMNDNFETMNFIRVLKVSPPFFPLCGKLWYGRLSGSFAINWIELH